MPNSSGRTRGVRSGRGRASAQTRCARRDSRGSAAAAAALGGRLSRARAAAGAAAASRSSPRARTKPRLPRAGAPDPPRAPAHARARPPLLPPPRPLHPQPQPPRHPPSPSPRVPTASRTSSAPRAAPRVPPAPRAASSSSTRSSLPCGAGASARRASCDARLLNPPLEPGRGSRTRPSRWTRRTRAGGVCSPGVGREGARRARRTGGGGSRGS